MNTSLYSNTVSQSLNLCLSLDDALLSTTSELYMIRSLNRTRSLDRENTSSANRLAFEELKRPEIQMEKYKYYLKGN